MTVEGSQAKATNSYKQNLYDMQNTLANVCCVLSYGPDGVRLTGSANISES